MGRPWIAKLSTFLGPSPPNAAECRALHGDEHEGDGSGKDEDGLHVVAVGKFKFNSHSKVK